MCNQRSRLLMRKAMNKRTHLLPQLAYLPFPSQHCSQQSHKSQELVMGMVMVMVSFVGPTQHLRRCQLRNPNCFGDSSRPMSE